MKPWQRLTLRPAPARPAPDTVPCPPETPVAPIGQAQPIIEPETGLTLDQRVAGLENKAFYDGQYIAQLRAELTAAGQCIDALACRLGALADRVNQSGGGISQPIADNPPGV